MEQSYLKVIQLCPDLDAEMYFQLGWLYFDLKKYKEAEKQLKKFLEFDKLNEAHAKKAEGMMVKANLLSHPVSFDPKPVKDISTADPEYLPYISPDNEFAFFTRRFDMQDKNSVTGSQSVEKFMMAERVANGIYDKGKPMPLPFNSKKSNNEGGASITIDNQHLFFTVNINGNFDICTSDFVDGHWTEIRNLGPNVNDPVQWDSQPSISSDGKTLYFASARDSSTGTDIYKTTKDANGNWTKAVKLSSKINTNGNEKSPFIHPDNHTLYFSSDSLPGLGGYDIFMTKLDSAGNWSTPVNLGYPINTEADEVGFFVSTDGKKGYYASNKLGQSYDIYSFDLYPAVRPDTVLLVKGVVADESEKNPVSARVEIKDVITQKITPIEADSVTGRYAAVVKFNHDLMLTVKKKGYAFQSQYISHKDSNFHEPVKVDLAIQKLKLGEQYTLHDILFLTNSYDINDTIKAVLDNFADFLKDNPSIKLALNGYTDNIGDSQDNIKLSNNRAKTVYDYLVSKGIDPERLSYKGLGDTRPVASNNTDEGRAKNRRTVFVITAK
jgi:outer membrane protein OmpA-like peptidoglycan-associated protein